MSPEVVSVSFKLPSDIVDQLDAVAKRELLSRSDIIRRLLIAGLKKAVSQ